MLWSEFLAGLDKIRSEIRSSRGLKVPADLSTNDSIIRDLYALLNSGLSAQKQAEPKLPEPVNEYASLAPEEEPSSPAIVNIVDRGEGEGRMLVMAREKPFVPKKPVLEEVFDEKELGK